MRTIMLAVTALSVVALVGCSSGGSVGGAPESTQTPDAAPAAQLDQAYLDAAAYGAAADPPFDVYYPAYLPEGFALTEATWVNPDDVPTGESGGLYTTYVRDEAVIAVGVAVGDIGEATTVATLPWGGAGDVPVYPDAWEGSYIAIGPSASAYRPVVRVQGVSLGELTAVLGAMTRVTP